jgi:ribosomal protein S18 acetylase RimI-like enzyme
LYQIDRQDAVADGNPLGPAIPFIALLDGEEVASGNLMAKSWMGDETGRLVNVRWSPGHVEAARQIVEAAVAPATGGEVNAATNADFHSDPAERVALFESTGFELWQEKEGFLWTDEGQDLPEPDRVVVRTVAEFGADRFAGIFAECTAGSLDRIDADTVAKMGQAAWAAAFIASVDVDIWLVAETPEGEPVGFVGVGEFDPGVGTITNIMVRPGHRGRGYVDQLLRAANRRARELGYGTMLSDSDMLNVPMHAALERNGHHAAATAWHKWMHRRKV